MTRMVNARGYVRKMPDGWHAGVEWPDGRMQCVTTGNPTREEAAGKLRDWVAVQGGSEVKR